MAYTNEDIQHLAVNFMDDDTKNRSKSILPAVCRSAEAELKSRLKYGVSVDSIEDSFISAAAVLAAAMCMDLSCACNGAVESFKAGNLEVSLGEAAPSAGLRRQAECILRPYIGDGGFGFLGVDG